MSVVRARTDAPHHVAATTDSPPARGGGSPWARRLRPPSWRDRRLVVGATLLLASTVLGARLLGTPDDGITVWSAKHDLPAGLTVRAADLEARQVRLDHGATRYVAANGEVPSGLVLARPVGRGELLPAAAVAVPGTRPDLRVVTVPVERFHVADDLGEGEQVDVYVSPRDGSAATSARTSRLLAADADVVAIEQDGGRFGGSGATRGIAVAVPAASVAALVGGLGEGTVDVVRIGGGQP